MRWGRLVVASVVVAITALACDPPADRDWIAARLAEVHERDSVARASHVGDDERSTWTLEIVAPDGTSEILPFASVAALPRTEVATVEPDEAAHDEIVRFSGVRIADLVRRAEDGDHSSDVTVVASDGFRATLQMEDVRLFPILLAMDADGSPLGRDHGGPLYSVLPITLHPDLAQRYTSSSWVFYVTHLLVGTAPPSVRIGSRDLSAADLDGLPPVTLSAVVGYRTGWPSEPVLLEGVRLRDALALAGVSTREGDRVRVMSRALVTRSDERPTLITAHDVATEDAMLALRYGESREPIPSRLGGPVALAFPETVAGHLSDHDWLTFVNEVTVVPGDGAADTDPAP
jgi:hypothetical protein